MKKQLTLLVTLVCISLGTVSAQKFAGGAHLGFSKLNGDLSGGGLNWILDARYFITDNFTAGVEYNSSVMKAGGDLLSGWYGGKQFLVKADYFLGSKKVKPYAGLGLGFASVETPEVTVGTKVYPAVKRSGFGLSPRLGLMLGNFALEFQYNIAGKTPIETGVDQADKKFNFITFNLGYVYTLDLNDK